MPVYQLNEVIGFPDPSEANDDGLLAIGGDLSAERLITAYSLGIFPWFNEGESILWWSPNPRLILDPENFKLSKSLKRTVKKKSITVVFDEQFEKVIEYCAETLAKMKKVLGLQKT